MTTVTLAQARTMIDAALVEAEVLKLKPLSVVVLDPGGHVVASVRQDGASNLRPKIAVAKAAGALGLGVSSRKIGEMAAERPSFLAALTSLSDNGLIPAAGGLIVTGASGAIMGAIGVTGDTSDNDELCAHAGVAAARLTVLA
jgi:uncharacterized protein GlcG (DUF336 family)